MKNEESRLYDKAIVALGEIDYGRWPFVSKVYALVKSREILTRYRDAVLKAREEELKRDLKEKEGKLHKYKVIVGYEKFPNYHDITQEGEWFIFYYNRIIVTTRHKDEKIDHTIYYKDIVISAKNQEVAQDMIERNSEYHLCSFVFDELSSD